MTHDIRRLLEEAAPQTVPPVDLPTAAQAGRRRSRRTRAVTVAVIAAALAGGAGYAQSALNRTDALPAPFASDASTAFPHTIRTHCGVISTTVDGQLWLADPPLGDGNPPPGWDENESAGVFRITSPGEARFEADQGQTARFVLAPPGVTDPAAGCS